MRHIVVEYLYEPFITEQALSASFERLQPYLDVRDIRRLRSWVADDAAGPVPIRST